MAWTPEHCRRYAPTIDHMVRATAFARLAAIIDAIDTLGLVHAAQLKVWADHPPFQWLSRIFGAGEAVRELSCP
jgi:hypothetical protein